LVVLFEYLKMHGTTNPKICYNVSVSFLQNLQVGSPSNRPIVYRSLLTGACPVRIAPTSRRFISYPLYEYSWVPHEQMITTRENRKVVLPPCTTRTVDLLGFLKTKLVVKIFRKKATT
jgi:hypothetical protein